MYVQSSVLATAASAAGEGSEGANNTMKQLSNILCNGVLSQLP